MGYFLVNCNELQRCLKVCTENGYLTYCCILFYTFIKKRDLHEEFVYQVLLPFELILVHGLGMTSLKYHQNELFFQL